MKTTCRLSYLAQLGVPGGLDAQNVTIEDQKKWDGKGSPLEQ